MKRLLSILLLVAPSAWGATYYVRTDGNNANAGTADNAGGAWLTISKSLGAVAGDMVYVRTGTFTENVAQTNNGTSGNRITYNLSATTTIAGKLTVTGNYVTWNNGTCSPPVYVPYEAVLVNGYNIVVSNLEVTAYGAAAGDQATGITTKGGNNEIVDCRIHDMNNIDATHPWGNTNTFRRLLIYNINWTDDANHTDQAQVWGNGDPSTYIYFIDCLFTNNACQGINTSDDNYDNLHHWYFINCIFKDIGGSSYGSWFSGLGNTKFYNCIFDNCVGHQYGTILAFYGINLYTSTGSEVQNCVFFRGGAPIGFNGASASEMVIGHNYIATGSYGPQYDYVGSSSVVGTNADFASTNTASVDYHIGSLSALRGKGTNLSAIFNYDRDGNARSTWDIGPYEYAVGSSPPSNVVGPSAVTNSAGINLSLSVTVSGTQPLAYQWRMNTNALSGATSSSYTSNSATSTASGWYDVVITNSYGSITSSIVYVQLTNAPASIVTQPVAQTNNVGESMTISVVAAGTAPLAYQWRLNTNAIAGATSATYTTNNAQPSNSGWYDVVVTNSTPGNVTSAPVYVSISTNYYVHFILPFNSGSDTTFGVLTIPSVPVYGPSPLLVVVAYSYTANGNTYTNVDWGGTTNFTALASTNYFDANGHIGIWYIVPAPGTNDVHLNGPAMTEGAACVALLNNANQSSPFETPTMVYLASPSTAASTSINATSSTSDVVIDALVTASNPWTKGSGQTVIDHFSMSTDTEFHASYRQGVPYNTPMSWSGTADIYSHVAVAIKTATSNPGLNNGTLTIQGGVTFSPGTTLEVK